MSFSGIGGTTYAIGAADGSTWRKLDIMERIIQQDPRATPFFEMTGMTKSDSATHRWQVRGVKARATNKQTEGFTFVGQEVSAPSRVSNTTQIFATPVEVTRTTQREMHYGVNKIWNDQINLRSYEHRADIEYDLIRNTEVTGATGTAREMDGLLASVVTNATDQAGAVLTEEMIIDMTETSWDNQDAPVLTALVPKKIKRVVDQFSSLGAIRNMEVRIRDITHTVMKYYGSFGEVDFALSRDLLCTPVITAAQADGELVMFDPRQYAKAYLDRTHLQPTAKVKDADTLVILSELTLEYGNEKGAVKYTNVNVTL